MQQIMYMEMRDEHKEDGQTMTYCHWTHGIPQGILRLCIRRTYAAHVNYMQPIGRQRGQ